MPITEDEARRLAPNHIRQSNRNWGRAMVESVKPNEDGTVTVSGTAQDSSGKTKNWTVIFDKSGKVIKFSP